MYGEGEVNFQKDSIHTSCSHFTIQVSAMETQYGASFNVGLL